MLKMELFDCAVNEKCCSVDGGRGICPFFSSPPRGIWQRKSPHPQEFAIQCPGVSPGGGGEGGLGAGGIDWFWIRVRGQFEIKILTVRGDSDINTTDFIWIIGKNKLEPAINWNW